MPACRTLDCITVLASTAQDAAAVDAIVAAFDAADPSSRRAPAEARRATAAERIAVVAVRMGGMGEGWGGARRRGDGDCWLLNARAYDQQCTLCTYAQGRTFAGQWLICGGGIVCEPSIGSEHALPLFYLIV